MLDILYTMESTCNDPALFISLHYSFNQINKYLLNICYMPGPVLGSGVQW